MHKDIERCFGVLVCTFGILERPLRGWYLEEISELVTYYVIIHSTTIQERRPSFVLNNLKEPENEERDDDADAVPITLFTLEAVEPNAEIGAVLATRVANIFSKVKDKARLYTLMREILEHISNVYSNNNNNN